MLSCISLIFFCQALCTFVTGHLIFCRILSVHPFPVCSTSFCVCHHISVFLHYTSLYFEQMLYFLCLDISYSTKYCSVYLEVFSFKLHIFYCFYWYYFVVYKQFFKVFFPVIFSYKQGYLFFSPNIVNKLPGLCASFFANIL